MSWQAPAVWPPPVFTPTGVDAASAADSPALSQWKRLNAMAGNAGLFDAFESNSAQPRLRSLPPVPLRRRLLHPFQSAAQSRALSNNLAPSGETLAERLAMLRQMRETLDGEAQRHLDVLLQNGRLTDIRSENRHSTLYQLYAILTARRQEGLDNRQVLRETLAILATPESITQKITPLSESNAQALLKIRNGSPLLNREGVLPPAQPLTRADVEVSASNACVPSSVMFYMADKNPSEFTRQVNELTSPMSAFLRTVPLSAISPDNPGQARAILDQNYVPYALAGSDQVRVRVSLPPAGVARAINDSQRDHHFKTRSGVETAYQSALAFLATQRTYDPAIDQSADYLGGPMLQGLNAAQKDLMETLIKGGGGVTSVNLMITGAPPAPQSDEEAQQPILYGYTRSFEQTQADLIAALDAGEYVIIGFVPVAPGGRILTGHEITLAGYERDARTGDVRFITFDSDDNNPQKVVRPARELIPRIHHAGLPTAIARRVQSQIAQAPGYFKPNAQDVARFKPVATAPQAPPPEALADAFSQVSGLNVAPPTPVTVPFGWPPAPSTPFPGGAAGVAFAPPSGYPAFSA